jgi:predicted RNA-binding protein associated with RNAse of E/G family
MLYNFVMSLHKPKLESSHAGLGLPNTTRTMNYLDQNTGILTEIWNDMSEPWAEGETVIARPGWRWVSKWQVGKPYNIVKFFTETGKLVGVYVDVCEPVKRTANGFEFLDLYLDIWTEADKTPVLLDENELTDALEAGYITPHQAQKARLVASQVMEMLKDPATLNFE